MRAEKIEEILVKNNVDNAENLALALKEILQINDVETARKAKDDEKVQKLLRGQR